MAELQEQLVDILTTAGRGESTDKTAPDCSHIQSVLSRHPVVVCVRNPRHHGLQNINSFALIALNCAYDYDCQPCSIIGCRQTLTNRSPGNKGLSKRKTLFPRPLANCALLSFKTVEADQHSAYEAGERPSAVFPSKPFGQDVMSRDV